MNHEPTNSSGQSEEEMVDRTLRAETATIVASYFLLHRFGY